MTRLNNLFPWEGTIMFNERTALVVDDSPTSLRIMERVLQKLGFTVLTAENGLEAVNKFCANVIDIIIMDVMMPIVDGKTATRVIRLIEDSENMISTPIIIWTATDEEITEKTYECGCTKILKKPLDVVALKQTLFELESGNLSKE